MCVFKQIKDIKKTFDFASTVILAYNNTYFSESKRKIIETFSDSYCKFPIALLFETSVS